MIVSRDGARYNDVRESGGRGDGDGDGDGEQDNVEATGPGVLRTEDKREDKRESERWIDGGEGERTDRGSAFEQ